MNQQTDLLRPNGLRDTLQVSGVSREQIRVLDSLYFIAASITNCNSSHRRLLYHIRNPVGRLCNELHKKIIFGLYLLLNSGYFRYILVIWHDNFHFSYAGYARSTNTALLETMMNHLSFGAAARAVDTALAKASENAAE